MPPKFRMKAKFGSRMVSRKKHLMVARSKRNLETVNRAETPVTSTSGLQRAHGHGGDTQPAQQASVRNDPGIPAPTTSASRRKLGYFVEAEREVNTYVFIYTSIIHGKCSVSLLSVLGNAYVSMSCHVSMDIVCCVPCPIFCPS